jgi:hypothetical protein
MKNLTMNKSSNVSKNTIVIKNGMRYVKNGNCLTFTGVIKTCDPFHTYNRKQIA